MPRPDADLELEAHLRPYVQACRFDKLRDVYAEIEGDLGRVGLRALGRIDRFYLLTCHMGRTDAVHRWLYERTREVEAAPDGHLDLWAREHYKSTIITFAGVIQELLLDPELTVGIFSHTRPVAAKFLRQIKEELENNARLISLYDEVLWAHPHKDALRWSIETGIAVKRDTNPKEASVEAHGLVEGMPTGAHFGLLVYDDVVTPASVTTPEQVKRTTEMHSLSDNLGARGANGLKRKWHIGTRYCTVAGTRITMGDWTQKSIERVRVGDVVVGWQLQDGKRRLCPAVVKAVGKHDAQPVNRYTFDDGASVTCTADHRWWRGPHGAGEEYRPIGPGLKDAKTVRRLLYPTRRLDSRTAAWVAGMYDGEGTFKKNALHPSGIPVITQTMHNPDLIMEIRSALDFLGFAWSEAWIQPQDGWSERCNFQINGGWRERYRFLVEVAPVRALQIEQSLYGALETTQQTLTSVEPAGEADVYWIETETGNYVAEGLCSKNSFADTYGNLLDRKVLIPRIYPATDDGSRDGRPVFLSPEAWEEIKRVQVSSVLAAQMLQNPAAGNEAMFQKDWLRFTGIRPATLSIALLGDGASSKKKGADRTAMYIVGMDAGRNRYLLDGYHHRMKLEERWRRFRDLWLRWFQAPGVQSIRAGYERYASDADLDYFQERMEIEKLSIPIEELNWPSEGPGSKLDRIQRLEPHFRNGRMYLIEVPGKDAEGKPTLSALQQKMVDEGAPWRVLRPIRCIDENGEAYSLNKRLIDEYLTYPYSTHDDGLDALSRMEDIGLQPPVLLEQGDLEPEAV